MIGQARDWLSVEWLPPYAPESSDIERDWRHLKCHHLAHQTFINIDRLEYAIHDSIQHINHHRLSQRRQH